MVSNTAMRAKPMSAPAAVRNIGARMMTMRFIRMSAGRRAKSMSGGGAWWGSVADADIRAGLPMGCGFLSLGWQGLSRNFPYEGWFRRRGTDGGRRVTRGFGGVAVGRP